jgi:hypothetical protein
LRKKIIGVRGNMMDTPSKTTVKAIAVSRTESATILRAVSSLILLGGLELLLISLRGLGGY